MKERPILFSTPMVRAILEGHKTQTRREIKHFGNLYHIDKLLCDWYCSGDPYIQDGQWFWELQTDVDDSKHFPLKCPYGQPGDILWVRETWAHNPWSYLGGCKYVYRSDYESFPKCEIGTTYPAIDKWRPSIFMPKEACRLFLEVTDVRAERLQDISEKDAIAEGIEKNKNEVYKDYLSGEFYRHSKQSFLTLWTSINGKGSWESNPFVWVIAFKRIDK